MQTGNEMKTYLDSGDDIIITDDGVSSRYQQIRDTLGVIELICALVMEVN